MATTRTKTATAPSATELLKQGLTNHPEVELVLEIATRARELAAMQEPVSLDAATTSWTTPTASVAPGLE